MDTTGDHANDSAERRWDHDAVKMGIQTRDDVEIIAGKEPLLEGLLEGDAVVLGKLNQLLIAANNSVVPVSIQGYKGDDPVIIVNLEVVVESHHGTIAREHEPDRARVVHDTELPKVIDLTIELVAVVNDAKELHIGKSLGGLCLGSGII